VNLEHLHRVSLDSPSPSAGYLLSVAVHLTRIYTKTGDDGTTALGNLARVRKTDPRVGAYADCDETNASLGTALALGALPEPIAAVLRQIQNDLFDLGADLSTPIVAEPAYPPLRVTEAYVTRLEGWCDAFNEPLGKLTSFILPGGTPGAALLHQSRTLARRAERSAWLLYEADPEHTNRVAMTYLNRLSDLLFILARVANPGGDVLWQPGGGTPPAE
jgi:cob(I)alamin adenosyltransferase